MRTAQLDVTRTVKLDGVKPTWKISKSSDTVDIDGVTYVRVNGYMYTLNSLVACGNDEVPNGCEHTCVSLSKGLKSLISTRNQKQSEAFQEENRGCTMFAAPKNIKHVVPHAQKADMRRTPQTLQIIVEVGGNPYTLEVLRPVHPKDNLFIACTAPMIATLLHILRTGGFDEQTRRVKQPGLPKGIHKRKGFLVAKYTNGDGSNGFKRCKTVDDAIAFLAGGGEVDAAEGDEALEEYGEAAHAEGYPSGEYELDASGEPDQDIALDASNELVDGISPNEE